MHRIDHPLPSDVPGTARHLVSHHFGVPGAGEKIYLQSGLHADELPGQLVLWHLIEQLRLLEEEDRIAGEIVVVPCANPIGLSQGFLWDRVGRFELYSGQNFNRHYPDLKKEIGDRIEKTLGEDASANLTLVRGALREALAAYSPATELEALRHCLLSLAADSDVVLDLHCDLEAVMHIYTTPAGEKNALSLSRHVGARAILLAGDSGGRCFDETCSTLWDALRARFADRHPIPAGCFSATLELRGQADVGDALARDDAARLIHWFAERGVVKTQTLPTPQYPTGESSPLGGTEDLVAPRGGILSFLVEVGARVVPGTPIADIIDQVSGERVTVTTQNEGLVYARDHRRFVRRGSSIALISGQIIRRTDNLLSA